MVNNTLYRQLIWCLFYITHTQPDLYYAVSVDSRYMDQSHEIHWRETKRIPNFVQGTRTHGIFYKAKSDLELIGFTDSDWESDNTDRNSTSGYVFMISKVQSSSQARNRVPLHSHLQKQSIEEL